MFTEATFQKGLYWFDTRKGNRLTLSILGGAEFFFNESIGVEINAGYLSKIEDIKNGYKSIDKGLQVNIGLQFHLMR